MMRRLWTTIRLYLAGGLAAAACGAEPPPADPPPAAPERRIVLEFETTGEAKQQECVDGGSYVVQAAALSATTDPAATAVLSRPNGTEDGEYIESAIRFAGQPSRVESAPFVLAAGECVDLYAQSGIPGARVRARLVAVELRDEP